MPGASQAALPQPREETAAGGCPGVQNLILPNETHILAGKVERGTGPSRHLPREGSPVLLLNRAACGDHPGLGAAWEIVLHVGATLGDSDRNALGCGHRNQAAEKLSQITNIMCSHFKTTVLDSTTLSPSCPGKAQSSPPRGQHGSQGWMAVLPICPWVSPLGPLSAACRAQRHCGSALVGKPRPEVAHFQQKPLGFRLSQAWEPVCSQEGQ